jgi:carboxypeptidase family protein
VNAIRARFVKLWLSFALLSISHSLAAQISLVNLSGSVKDPSGSAIAEAKVVAKNLNTAATQDSHADSVGNFGLSLEPGAYELSITAEGFESKTAMVTIAPNASQSLTFTLAPVANSIGGNLPNAPSATQTSPSLSDLGFPPEQTQSNAKEQALLDKRTHMLKIHQKLGLITAAPLLATLVTSMGAGGHNTSSTDRTVHMILGAVTSDLYFTSAYFAIRAPRVPGTTTRGPIRLHKALAWVHGPGMILTPILGALAYDQKSNGEKVHGIASAHGPVAAITAAAFGAALLSVSVKF